MDENGKLRELLEIKDYQAEVAPAGEVFMMKRTTNHRGVCEGIKKARELLDFTEESPDKTQPGEAK